MTSKSFWRRPEGVTGAIVLAALIGGGAWLLLRFGSTLVAWAEDPAALAAMLAALGGVLYLLLDPHTRNLLWYFYKAAMRWITGLFVHIDPISVLKDHIQHLEKNLIALSRQIGVLRKQMRDLKGIMDGNTADIEKNMTIANEAKRQNDDKNLTLATRKAGRLQEANAKYAELYRKMDNLYRVLRRMYEHSEIVIEDTRDQIALKEQEYQAIKASHSAMRSAQSILKGNPDQRALFDHALEQLAEEVSQKVGSLERFTDTTRHLMDSIDLQNGVFEDEGLRLLEQWEKQTLSSAKTSSKTKSNEPPTPDPLAPPRSDYSQLF
ncbi:MAG: hypothetical protein RMJ33_10290 [Saprospiraceae bacterium]|nr:hypothetical protein [Saprospiraceae bacterium]MDW8230215.1 hypothetical protein [Saprospiraceae bacterium]